MNNEKLFVYLQHVLPQHALSRFMYLVATCPWPWFKNALINYFIKQYGVNMAEALYPDTDQYAHFNAFFTRELTPGARSICEGDEHIACPADGAVSQWGTIEHGRLMQAKGQDYSLIGLLGQDTERAKSFVDGEFITIYLSPKDYHRVHAPITGTLKQMIYVPGRLFSVNQATTNQLPGLFAKNERVICIFDTAIGPVAVILVGAMIVASIRTQWAGLVTPMRRQIKVFDYGEAAREPIILNKGDTLGQFELGSTVILLFPKNTIHWSEELKENMTTRMGQSLATIPAATKASEPPSPQATESID